MKNSGLDTLIQIKSASKKHLFQGKFQDIFFQYAGYEHLILLYKHFQTDQTGSWKIIWMHTY